VYIAEIAAPILLLSLGKKQVVVANTGSLLLDDDFREQSSPFFARTIAVCEGCGNKRNKEKS